MPPACLLSGDQTEEPEAAGNGSTLGMKRVIILKEVRNQITKDINPICVIIK